MADVRINQLPLATGPTAPAPSDNLAIDGTTTRRAPLSSIGDVVRPFASQAEAEAGTSNAKTMTPLTTAQAIDAQAVGIESAGATGLSILATDTIDDAYTALTTAVWDSGTSRTMKQRATDTYCILDAPGNPDPTGNNLSTTSLNAMFDEANNGAGIKLDLMYGNFKTTDGLYLNAPAEIIGRGRGYWHPKPPTSGDGTSSVAATQIAMVGTGTKEYTVSGVSSMRASGGVVSNPSASNGNDSEYSLSSFINPVSDGALPRSLRQISAALWLGPDAVGSVIRGIRILPHGGGLKSLDKYVTAGAASDPWADDWDYGLVVEMANRILIQDCEFVGHYRGAGELVLGLNNDPSEESESGREALWGAMHVRSTFSGYRGVEVRGPDAFRVVTVAAGYIEVPWSDDHPFDNTVYPYFSYGTGSFTSAGQKTFTGMSKVGSNLRLSMADTTGISVGSQIFSRRYFGGTSHCTWDLNCAINGMNHQSGNPCHAAALGSNAMPNPGAAFVASGWRMTELEFYGKIQSIEEVGIHAHSVAGSIITPQLEGSGPKPLRIIKSPSTLSDNTRVANPAGITQTSYIDSARGLKNETGIDARPILNSVAASSAYPSDPGMFLFSSNDTCEVASMDLRNANGDQSFDYDRVNGRNRTSAHIEPSADNTYDIGTSNRFRSVRGRQLFFGSGTARLTGGLGNPNGAQGGNSGSIYMDESTGGKLYKKLSSSGSADWYEIPSILRVSQAWDPASIPSGSRLNLQVTIPETIDGSWQFIANFSLDTQGLGISCNYRNATSVTVTLINNTGGAIDLGAGTVNIIAFRP